MMLSFVLCSRDDRWGGEVEGIDNFTVRRLNITLASIYALGVDCEVILVDFCPINRSLKDYVNHYPVRTITVKPELMDLLDEDARTQKLPFYEYLAKDIGIKRAKGDFIIACNPDNILPLTNFDEVIKDLERGYVVRAMRCDIGKEYAKLDNSTLIEMANKDEFKVIQRYKSAGGDFTAMRKEIYREVGGYILAHGNNHLDNEFVDRAKLVGLEVSSPYSHYHIQHDLAAQDKLKGRPMDWMSFKPISKQILDNLDEYVLA